MDIIGGMDLSLPDAKLADYLSAHVPGFAGPLRSTKFKGGQSNPTYLIEAASGRYVLRRKPPGPLLASAHAVDREFRVLQALPGMEPAQRAAHYHAIIATLAALHGVDVDAVGLSDYGKPGNYFARQLIRWSEQYAASRTRDIPAMDALIEKLPARCPADDGDVALTHGDYRIDNLMFAPEAVRVAAVVDWELSTLGHPL